MSYEGEIYHVPPPVEQLEERLEMMCAFANADMPGFIHPAVRSIILHFWLAYDHPFVDGNGRTARALFYWSMLRHGYWLFEFISISSVINKARGRYASSFLLSESDDNDLTYFLLAQVTVIQQAITNLHAYLERKAGEVGALQRRPPCPAPRRLPLHGALPPEQPWREQPDGPQRSAEAGGPRPADPGEGWQAGDLPRAG